VSTTVQGQVILRYDNTGKLKHDPSLNLLFLSRLELCRIFHLFPSYFFLANSGHQLCSLTCSSMSILVSVTLNGFWVKLLDIVHKTKRSRPTIAVDELYC
jgi:hypothetical protein